MENIVNLKGELILKKLNLLWLFLCFSLLLGGCSSSNNSENSSTPESRTITANLPSTYLNNNETIALPSGKSCVIVTAGFDESQTLVFQNYTFTQTGSPVTINITDMSNVTYLSFVTEISLDDDFNDLTSWSYASRENIIMAPALRDLINGTKTNLFDSTITEIKFTDLKIIKNTTFTKEIKKMINTYCSKFNIKLAQQL
jgi:hypothetical protein